MANPIMGFISGTTFTQRKLDIDQVKLLMALTQRGDAPEWYGIRQLNEKFIVCMDIDFQFEQHGEEEEWRIVRS
jgi:hypothetical protein